MPGKLYLGDARLTKAYAMGLNGKPSSNPFASGTPENAAYTDGASACKSTPVASEAAVVEEQPVARRRVIRDD